MPILILDSSQAAVRFSSADLVAGDPAQPIVGGGGFLMAAGRAMPTGMAGLLTGAQADSVGPSQCKADADTDQSARVPRGGA